MRIEIPSKRFFMVISVVFGLLLIGGVFAVYDPTKGSHDTLWTDRIEPKTAARIIVAGDMEVTGQLIAAIPGSGGGGGTGGTSISCQWDGWNPVNADEWVGCGVGYPSCRQNSYIQAFCSGGYVTQMRIATQLLDCACGGQGGGY
jgi:hypothetical protein